MQDLTLGFLLCRESIILSHLSFFVLSTTPVIRAFVAIYSAMFLSHFTWGHFNLLRFDPFPTVAAKHINEEVRTPWQNLSNCYKQPHLRILARVPLILINIPAALVESKETTNWSGRQFALSSWWISAAAVAPPAVFATVKSGL